MSTLYTFGKQYQNQIHKTQETETYGFRVKAQH